MLVGFLGGTPFITSRQYIYTFDDYTRGSAARYAKHDIIGEKPYDIESLMKERQAVREKINELQNELDSLIE